MDKPDYAANVDWDESGQPISKHYGDVYFSKENGLEETRYVFLNANKLREKFSALSAGEIFTVAETGFGTGLNFLACWQLWLECAVPGAKLHFVSCEKFPLSKNELATALSLWPELNPLSEQLIALYPPTSVRGFHRINFNTHVSLTLILDDVFSAFSQMLCIEKPGTNVSQQRVNWSEQYPNQKFINAWFLDGFAPAKNPEMWQQNLFDLMAKLSKHNASFATFTAASVVRKGLSDAGFLVEKIKGFGRKREMLAGQFQKIPDDSPAIKRKPDASWHLCESKPATIKNVAIVGAGLAGAQTAFALAQRGYKVDIFDKNTVASGGSGNPVGVLYDKLSVENEVHSQVHELALSYALNFYHQNGFFEECGDACGVLQLASNETFKAQFEAVAKKHQTNNTFVQFLDELSASEISGVPLSHSALYFSLCGWLNPPKVCEKLLNHKNITIYANTEILKIEADQNAWQLESESKNVFRADAFVLCNAHLVNTINVSTTLPAKAIRGQVSLARSNPQSQKLKTAICGEGYIAPSIDCEHCLGASFDLKDKSNQLKNIDHEQNLKQAAKLSSAFNKLNVQSLDSGRASLRCTTPDYLPIVGPLMNEGAMLERFAHYRKNSKHVIDHTGCYLPGAFVNIGHGSKGLCTTPLCAEIIANLIHAELPALPRELMLHVHSARFLVRDLARNRL